MSRYILWVVLANESSWRRLSLEPPIYSQWVRSTDDNLDLWLDWGRGEGQPCRTEPLTCGIQSLSPGRQCQTELNCRTSSGCQRIFGVVENSHNAHTYTHTHTHTHTHTNTWQLLCTTYSVLPRMVYTNYRVVCKIIVLLHGGFFF